MRPCDFEVSTTLTFSDGEEGDLLDYVGLGTTDSPEEQLIRKQEEQAEDAQLNYVGEPKQNVEVTFSVSIKLKRKYK